MERPQLPKLGIDLDEVLRAVVASTPTCSASLVACRIRLSAISVIAQIGRPAGLEQADLVGDHGAMAGSERAASPSGEGELIARLELREQPGLLRLQDDVLVAVECRPGCPPASDRDGSEAGWDDLVAVPDEIS